MWEQDVSIPSKFDYSTSDYSTSVGTENWTKKSKFSVSLSSEVLKRSRKNLNYERVISTTGFTTYWRIVHENLIRAFICQSVFCVVCLIKHLLTLLSLVLTFSIPGLSIAFTKHTDGRNTENFSNRTFMFRTFYWH